MANVGLTTSLTESLIGRFSSLSNSSATSSLASALQGQSDTVSLSSTLRSGARLYGTAIQGLNSLVSFTHFARSSLGQLLEYTDKMGALAERASESRTSSSTRGDLELQFEKLATEFKSVLDNAKIGDQNYLTKGGLAELFSRMGLDEKTSSSVAEIFQRFAVVPQDDSLASENNQGSRPVALPAGLRAKDFESVFDPERTLRRRGDAYKLAADLKSVHEQIADNLKTLDQADELVQQNIELVRATGLALLDLSKQISGDEDAHTVAASLNQLIRQRAPAALAQAENLDPITVAALNLGAGTGS